MRLAVAGAHLDGFSGIPRHLSAALAQHVEVARWDLPEYRPPLFKRVAERVRREQYLWDKDPHRCAFHSRALDAFAARDPVDAVLLFGSESCAFSRTRTPLFAFGDSLFGSRIDFYPDQMVGELSPRSISEGIEVQQRALDLLRLFFSTSRWAWDRAVTRFRYRVDPNKLRVTLVGANLPDVPATAAEAKPPLRFLWIGVDWQRKGGDVAIAAVDSLRNLGVEAELDVIGPVQPPAPPAWVRVHGRRTAETGLGAFYANSAAILLPTSADLTPVAIAEAAMYGRPAVAAPVGGIPELIRDGETGVLIESRDPSAWAARIEANLTALPGLGAAARRRYDDQLNWRTIAETIVRDIAEVL